MAGVPGASMIGLLPVESLRFENAQTHEKKTNVTD
jgi:hypothetical protein